LNFFFFLSFFFVDKDESKSRKKQAHISNQRANRHKTNNNKEIEVENVSDS
jgi:hypothetical protein